MLLIGVDGTNLSRILADPENDNFFELMDDSTTAASSIVGHTTISNPSWTSILTGVWGERTGVINNVFTPWTYDKFPTVFNQLETADRPSRRWRSPTGTSSTPSPAPASIPRRGQHYVPQLPGDTNWLATDDEVADATVAAIDVPPTSELPLLLLRRGRRERSHVRRRVRRSTSWPSRTWTTTSARSWTRSPRRHRVKQWTVIVVTDHGHQPQQGFGHGFQSPDETSTFVIANGADFGDGLVNPEYEIVDTTPTIVSLFGLQPRAGADGVTLQSLSDSDEDPVDLHQALEDEIATNQPPDFITSVALDLRTITSFVPYFAYDFKNQADASLPSYLLLPVDLLFDGFYLATNIPAQIVAFATGVSGASIFPLFPPAPPFPPAEESPTTSVLVVCAAPGSAALSCDASVA